MLKWTIAAVERETGLSKDVLRVWERRYGFPTPDRNANGDRLYADWHVERLRLIKRLLDLGYRPSKLIEESTDELKTLINRYAETRSHQEQDQNHVLANLLDLIRQHDANGFQQALRHQLSKQGLQHFVKDTVAVLAYQIGKAWESNQIKVFEEHLFTEVTERVLRQAIGALPSSVSRPRVVLTTVPDEPHLLGLLMFEALLALEGVDCIALGTRLPLLDMSLAVKAHQANVLALSFSGAFPHRQCPSLLQQLRDLIPLEIAIWAGGAGISRLTKIKGVHLLRTFDEGLMALADWKTQRA